MKLLSRQEEIILTSIWKLQDKAYGMRIREEIEKVTGVKWLFGSIYTPLSRLLEKGLITSTRGEPTPERGGRSKVYYHLTNEGKKALIHIQQLQSAVWSDMPALKLEK